MRRRLVLLLSLLGIIGATKRNASTVAMPIFIKMHKVGGTTMMELFECLEHTVMSSLMRPLAPLFPTEKSGRADNETAACRVALAKPWMHKTQAFWRDAGGARGLAHCAVRAAEMPEPHKMPASVPRFVTMVLLRRPVDRVVSALTFFHTSALSGLKPRVAPGTGAERLDAAIAGLFGEAFDSHAANHVGSLYEYADTLAPGRWREGRAGVLVAPTVEDVAAANASLSQFDVVGVTEEMPAFKALVARALGWRAELMCNAAALQNSRRAGAAELSPDARAHLEALLAPELAVYVHARGLHAAQRAEAARADSAFEASVALITAGDGGHGAAHSLDDGLGDGVCAEAARERSRLAAEGITARKNKTKSKEDLPGVGSVKCMRGGDGAASPETIAQSNGDDTAGSSKKKRARSITRRSVGNGD